MSSRMLVIPCLLVAAGCGGNEPVPAAADPTAARAVLVAALDAWKAGEPADQADRPTRVADEDWLAGLKLNDYTIDGEPRLVGVTVRQPVTLSQVDRRGKAVKKRVVYQVGTDPTPTVVRQDAP